MFNQMGLRNLRLFSGSGITVKAENLTILCGSNSAGKSTVVRSLLLLKQSFSGQKLIASGSMTDFGTFLSLRSFESKNESVGISIQNHFIVETENLKGLDIPQTLLDQNVYNDKGENKFTFYELEVSWSFYLPIERKSSLNKNESSLSRTLLVMRTGREEDALLEKAEFCLKIGGLPVQKWFITSRLGVKNEEPTFHIRLSKDYLIKLGGDSSFVMPEEDKDGYVEFEAEMAGLIPFRFRATDKTKGKYENESENLRPWSVPRLFSEVMTALAFQINQIDYLGPLRLASQRLYDLRGSSESNDESGKNLASMIKKERKKIVKNSSPYLMGELIDEPLDLSLGKWLEFMRTGNYPGRKEKTNEFDLRSVRGLVAELSVKSIDGEHVFSLADSGFGYSQVIPIIVRVLLMTTGQTMIIEQPEVHLNPALQIRLAEFFATMSLAGRQIIIETHSEHIVNAIRVLCAEKKGNGALPHRVSITFLEYDSEKREVTSIDMSVKSDGTISHWPKSFFGESISLSRRLLLAQDIPEA